MTANVGTAGPDRQLEPILTTCRRVQHSGFTGGEAANLVALVTGFAIGSQPWKVRIMPGAMDIYYPGAPHGITATHQDQVNAELLAFLRSATGQTRAA